MSTIRAMSPAIIIREIAMGIRLFLILSRGYRKETRNISAKISTGIKIKIRIRPNSAARHGKRSIAIIMEYWIIRDNAISMNIRFMVKFRRLTMCRAIRKIDAATVAAWENMSK